MATESSLLTQALKLPLEERAELIRQLIQSLEPEEAPDDQAEVDRLWGIEIADRLDRLERGETTAVDWRESMERLRRSLAEEDAA